MIEEKKTENTDISTNIKDLEEQYKESKKYFRIDFNTTNEKTGSLLSYLDEPLYDFFIQLKFLL